MTDTIWIIAPIVLIGLYALKRLSDHLLGDDPVCGDLYPGGGVECTRHNHHEGDHGHHYPGTGNGDDKSWTWPNKVATPAILPPKTSTKTHELSHDVARVLCAKTARMISERIAQDREESVELKEYRRGMMRAEEIAERVAREWER